MLKDFIRIQRKVPHSSCEKFNVHNTQGALLSINFTITYESGFLKRNYVTATLSPIRPMDNSITEERKRNNAIRTYSLDSNFKRAR